MWLLGCLPTAPGDVDVQTLFREKDQLIVSLHSMRFVMKRPIPHSLVALPSRPPPLHPGGDEDFALLERLAKDTRLTEMM